MRNYPRIRISRAVLMITILLIAAVGLPASADAPPDSMIGCLSPTYLHYTGQAGFSQTFTIPASGWLIGWPESTIYFWSPAGEQSASLSTQNSFMVTKADLDAAAIQPGVYNVSWGISWYTGGIPDYDWIGDGGWLPVTDGPTPTSVDKPSKTVHYTCTIGTGRYEGCNGVGMKVPLTSLNYAAFGPDVAQVSSGSITVPDSDYVTANIDVVYPKADYDSKGYSIWLSGDYLYARRGRSPIDRFDFMYWCSPDLNPNQSGIPYLCYSPFGVRSFVEYPQFNITDVKTSTTPPNSWPQRAIEPAYEDSVTYSWQKTYNEFHAESIVILTEDAAGTIIDPSDPNKKYSVAATAQLSDSTNVVEHDQGTSSWNTTGDLTWPTPGTNLPEFPSGNLRLGVQYDDGHIVLTGNYVTIDLSIYDAYTDNHAPFYVTDDTEGKTSIYYKMSAQAHEDGVNINLGGVKTVQGTPNKGQNVLQDAWDGTTSPDNYVNGGSYGLTFDVTPLSGSVGSSLWMNTSRDDSFIPELDETLTINVDIHEPVRRPQSTQAKLTAVIYDSDGEFIRLLANEPQANIDNQADHTDGHNELTWDGKDERQQVVDPGTYTLVLFAKDNAGVGCESGAVTTSLNVAEPPQTETVLEWPVELDDDNGNLPSGIPGYTASSSSVFVSIDGGVETTASSYQGGLFFVDAPHTPGSHTVTLRTHSSQFPEKTITVTYIVNAPDVSSPSSGSRFDPQTNGSISVTYNSQIADTVDAYVYDPFYQSACIDVQNPVPAADIMNGAVSTRLIRTVATSLSVVAGANSIQWDGKDDAGQFVAPGLYNIVVKRHNTDGLLDTETSVQVVIEHSVAAPTIAGITSHVEGSSASISWNTDVSTIGYVVYEVDGNPAGKARVTGASSTSHTVWFPGTASDTNYDYYVVAVYPTSGTSSVSQKQTVTTGNGPQIGTSTPVMISSTEVQVSYFADDPVFASIEYARVGPGVQIQWHKIEHGFPDEQHVFDLTGLQANSEYAYRIVTSADSSWTNTSKSSFQWFATKTTSPTVAFNDLENGQGVDSLSQVVVRASGSEGARFSTHGITKVELNVDGQEATSYTKATGSNYVDYTFDLTGMQLTDGVHVLEATAYDDFWKPASTRIELLLTTSGSQMQSAAVKNNASVLAESTQSQSSSPGVPKKKRYAQNVQQLSLKHALKVLQSWKTSQSSDQQKWASVTEHLVQGWIAQGHNLAKGNSSQMNAIAFMLENLGRYKQSDTLPARAQRRTIRSGENKCTTAVGDAYVLGNKHKHYEYGTDWPGKDPDYQALYKNYTPMNAYYLADKSTTLPNLSIVSNPPKTTGDIVARGSCLPFGFHPVGHAGIFIAKDTTISASTANGIRFNDWVNSYTKVLQDNHVQYQPNLTRHYTK